jgi:hypothetical protein
MGNWIERESTHSRRGGIPQTISDPPMRYFVKDNRNEDGKSPEGDLLDGVYQNRLAEFLLQHEYGKGRKNTRRRPKMRSDGVME